MNPGPVESMNNYIFGDSRFIGDLEVEVPMEFSINNIQFTDTVDNFMKMEDPDEDSPVKVEDFEYLRVDLEVENGFPLGILVTMSLYNSATGDTICPVNAKEILAAAPVGEDDKTDPVTSRTSITITDRFWSSVNEADMIIFRFALKSTDSETRDVKIYSDYGIDFKAALVLKPKLKFNSK